MCRIGGHAIHKMDHRKVPTSHRLIITAVPYQKRQDRKNRLKPKNNRVKIYT